MHRAVLKGGERPSETKNQRGRSLLPGHGTYFERLAVGGWWRLAVGGWQLVAVGGGCWGLVVGGGLQRLVVGGWWLVGFGSGRRLAVGGGWWRLVVGWGRSLRAVLNKKKTSFLRTGEAGFSFPGGGSIEPSGRTPPIPDHLNRSRGRNSVCNAALLLTRARHT